MLYDVVPPAKGQEFPFNVMELLRFGLLSSSFESPVQTVDMTHLPNHRYAFFPGTATMDAMFEQGYKDAERFFASEPAAPARYRRGVDWAQVMPVVWFRRKLHAFRLCSAGLASVTLQSGRFGDHVTTRCCRCTRQRNKSSHASRSAHRYLR